MSRMKRNHQADMAANGAWDRARQAAAQVKRVTAQVRPLARSAGAAAASAAAALALNCRKPEVTTSPADADADELTPAAQMRDGQARTSGRVRTS